MVHQSRSYFIRQQRSTFELKKAHPDVYHHYRSVGYEPEQATKMLKHNVGRANLQKLQDRFHIAQGSLTATGVNLDGIKETAEVKAYINQLVSAGLVTRGAGVLRLTKQRKY